MRTKRDYEALKQIYHNSDLHIYEIETLLEYLNTDDIIRFGLALRTLIREVDKRPEVQPTVFFEALMRTRDYYYQQYLKEYLKHGILAETTSRTDGKEKLVIGDPQVVEKIQAGAMPTPKESAAVYKDRNARARDRLRSKLRI